MKLPDILLIGFTIMFLIIGLDQTLVLGFRNGYWAFMAALVTFFLFTYRKGAKKAGSTDEPPAKLPKKGKKR
jgi:hypothetical protein